jgi:hypothetical protein
MRRGFAGRSARPIGARAWGATLARPGNRLSGPDDFKKADGDGGAA